MFLKYKKNFYSQNGEDGIILEVLKRLKIKNKELWCCEFGAWDGIHGSNTFNLVKNKNFNAVYIEGDKKKYKKLLLTKKKFPKIISFNQFVSKNKGSNLLDRILKKTSIPKNFEILSIDIDSYDLAVWKSLKQFRPKIVIIEINSGIPPGIEQTHSNLKIGNSFTSTIKHATKINYQLICHTGNCIFVDKKYSKKLKIHQKFNNNKNTDILFDNTWLNRKDFFLKEIIKLCLPDKLISLLRYLKYRIRK